MWPICTWRPGNGQQAGVGQGHPCTGNHPAGISRPSRQRIAIGLFGYQSNCRNCSGVRPASRAIAPMVMALIGSWRGITRRVVPLLMIRWPDFPHDAIAKLLEHPHGLLLADPLQTGHYSASSSVSTLFTPASSASTSSQRVMASRMFARASSRLSPCEWQPGRSRQLTAQPSSVSRRRMR